MALRLVYDLFGVITNLYLPLTKFKKLPSERETDVIGLRYKKAISLVHLDPKKCFTEFVRVVRMLNQFDITQIENGFGMWVSASGLFSWTGVSFGISKKILQYAGDIINNKDIKQVFYYELFELLHNSFTGHWSSIKGYDEDLATLNLRLGEAWHVSTYLVFHALLGIGQGAFVQAQQIISKLSEIKETYGNENATEYHYEMKIRLLVVSRNLHAALNEVNAGLSFHSWAGREMGVLSCLGYKAIIQVHLKQFDGARESLWQAGEIINKQGRIPPVYISSSLVGQFLFDLSLLEEALLVNDELNIESYRKMAYRSGMRALQNCRKYAFNRTESFKLMGRYFWLTGNQKRARTFWDKGVRDAESLNARPELARTYMEIGERLLESRSRFRDVNGISADEYLERARSLFDEMNLRFDLDQLATIKART
jgi:hypothetical protein